MIRFATGHGMSDTSAVWYSGTFDTRSSALELLHLTFSNVA